MEKKKSIGGIIALISGIVLVIGSIVTVIVIQHRRKQEASEDTPVVDLDKAVKNAESTGAVTTGNMGFTTEQVKIMQTYLLQLGIQHNNQYIIDAIQLTGGIDGTMGSGFHAAVREAKDRGYLDGYEDILRRLGY